MPTNPNEATQDDFESFLQKPVDPLADLTPDQKLVIDSQKTRDQKRIQDLKLQYKHALKENERLRFAFNALLGMDERGRRPLHVLPPSKPYKAKGRQYPSGDAVFVMMLSDNHLMEVVKLEEMNGWNEHNEQIAERRIATVFQNALWTLGAKRKEAKIDTGMIVLGGDGINGWIHDENRSSNSGSPTEEAEFFEDLFCTWLHWFAKHSKLKKIIVPCVSGNHDRLYKPKRVAQHYKESLLHWAYRRMMNRYFKKDRRFYFIVPDAKSCYLKLFDTRIHITHGDQITGGNGIGGIFVPIMRKVTKWQKNKPVDLTMIGHFHQLGVGPGMSVIINGSTVGANAFSANLLAAGLEPPQQAGGLIRPGRHLADFFPIFAETREQLAKYNYNTEDWQSFGSKLV